MAADHFQIPLNVEQDQVGGDDLPTYTDLAEQSGPNSRFGRWREWIEKRAAERYNDITPEELVRRRERGWGGDHPGEPEDLPPFVTVEEYAQTPPPTPPPKPPPKTLHVQTNIPPSSSQGTTTSTASSAPSEYSATPLQPLRLVYESLDPSHLLLNQFGSRFLPHATSTIRCLLPLLADRLLLIGHDEGLSVLNMFPQEWTDHGHIALKGPNEAQARLIWEGEGVYQMSILEEENTGEGSPQGVVLALVGPDTSSPKETETLRSLRMYNLASLTSLAKWTVAQNGAHPVDLRHSSNWTVQQMTPKKHRKQQNSITRSLKSLIESPSQSPSTTESHAPFPNLLAPSSAAGAGHAHTTSTPRTTLSRQSTSDSWDMVDDLPLRWATDFVPFASAGSRLVNVSVLFYDLFRENGHRTRGGATLAVATKSNIFLYETPKGERAFRFVKEFYTPMQPRRMTFIQQSVQEISRSLSQSPPTRYQSPRDRTISNHSPSSSTSTSRTIVNPDLPINYGAQQSLFVIFEKKAGWIRLADSAVGEIELYDDGPQQPLVPSTSSMRLTRRSFENTAATHHHHHHHHHPNKGHWVLPSRMELPTWPYQAGHSTSRSVYFLTRGHQTHILPCPLPTNIASRAPIHILSWRSTPRAVTPRMCRTSSPKSETAKGEDAQPFLQLIAFGEDGVEVQEVPLSFLYNNGKGKARADDSVVVRSQMDLGGDTGFLCRGGRWDRWDLLYGSTALSRSHSDASCISGISTETLASEDTNATKRLEDGAYGWCRKGAHDWRVFWLGGVGTSKELVT